MELLKELLEDHREIKILFQRLQMTSERGAQTRTKVFDQLRALLNAHSLAEENVLYDQLKKRAATHERALESIEEHHVIKVLLTELAIMPKGSENWGAKLKILKETFENHVRQEEKEVFKLARKFLTRHELAELALEFEAQKMDYLSGASFPTRLTRRLMRRWVAETATWTQS